MFRGEESDGSSSTAEGACYSAAIGLLASIPPSSLSEWIASYSTSDTARVSVATAEPGRGGKCFE
jgi:hypothetical protein